MPEKVHGNAIQAVAPGAGIEQVGGNHGVEHNAFDLDAVPGQNNEVIFDVLAHFSDVRIFKQRLENTKDIFFLRHRYPARVGVGHRDVESGIIHV